MDYRAPPEGARSSAGGPFCDDPPPIREPRTSNTPAAPASPAAPTKRRAPKPTVKRRKRAARGAHRAAVLLAVKDRSDATSAELSRVSGVDRKTLYGVLAPLVKDGELQTRSLATGRAGYSLAEPRPQER